MKRVRRQIFVPGKRIADEYIIRIATSPELLRG